MTILLFVLTLIASALAPTTATPMAASTATNTCYCQTMPMKDWGK